MNDEELAREWFAAELGLKNLIPHDTAAASLAALLARVRQETSAEVNRTWLEWSESKGPGLDDRHDKAAREWDRINSRADHKHYVSQDALVYLAALLARTREQGQREALESACDVARALGYALGHADDAAELLRHVEEQARERGRREEQEARNHYEVAARGD